MYVDFDFKTKKGWFCIHVMDKDQLDQWLPNFHFSYRIANQHYIQIGLQRIGKKQTFQKWLLKNGKCLEERF